MSLSREEIARATKLHNQLFESMKGEVEEALKQGQKDAPLKLEVEQKKKLDKSAFRFTNSVQGRMNPK